MVLLVVTKLSTLLTGTASKHNGDSLLFELFSFTNN